MSGTPFTVFDSKDVSLQGTAPEFRSELFNVLNHTNFRLPVSDINAPSTAFGQIQSDVSPRVIQVALKFLF